MSQETKQLFTELFDDDLSPSSAYRKFIDNVENEEHLADRFWVPDYKWVFNFYAQYIKRKFGTLNGIDVYYKIVENIESYNNDRGKELAKVKQTETGETIVVICDEFNRRVHENIPSAGDILIMDATSNLDRMDTKIFHLMCPSPVGGLPLGTMIMTRANENTIKEALDLYKTVLPDNAFYGKGRNAGPEIAMTDDDSAERNALKSTWNNITLLLCQFHHLNALWGWLWKREHDILLDDRPVLFNLVKRAVYARSNEEFDEAIETMEENDIYEKYENFKNHFETNILPRQKEWAIKERINKKLPTHGQNTTNYVEYSFRVTKDIQFSRLKAYNLVDLVDICLDDSKLNSRRCVDVSHNRNYHLFTNQKSRYLEQNNKIDSKNIIKITDLKYKVPSEALEDKLYNVFIEMGVCD